MYPRLFTLVCLLALGFSALGAVNDSSSDDLDSTGGAIISKYLQATQADSVHSADTVEVDIDASVPKLNQHGTLRALRKISEVGKITYRVLGFQGDNTIKNQVIARYLQAEQQGQDDNSIRLTRANYKFKLKGQKTVAGVDAYVFQVSPRSKRLGLFRGEVWLDARTCLPILEKGRLVKNPSIFFRKVDFERDFAISNGSAIPAYMNSTIDTRLVGRVNLRVAYVSPTAITAKTETSAEINATDVPASF